MHKGCFPDAGWNLCSLHSFQESYIFGNTMYTSYSSMQFFQTIFFQVIDLKMITGLIFPVFSGLSKRGGLGQESSQLL